MGKRPSLEKMVTRKNILVTGATGFIGQHLVKKLFGEFNISILKRTGSDLSVLDDVIENINIYDVNEIETLFKKNKIDVVLHLATVYAKFNSENDVSKMIHSNIEFPSKLLEVMKKYNVTRFINTGTFFEYNHESSEKISEKTEKKPFNLYAATKIAFFDICSHYALNEKFSVVDLKLFSPYGPCSRKLISTLFQSAIEDRPISIYSGDQRLDWTYYKDIVDAYRKSIEYILSMSSGIETFNLGCGNAQSIKNVIKLIEDITNKKITVAFHNESPNREIFFSESDTKKSKQNLRWDPKYLISEGLEDMYDEIKSNGNY